MSVVHPAPPFRYSKQVVLSDTTDNIKGSVGLHNASGTGGFVKVTYWDTADEGADIDDELFIAAGDFVLITARRLWSTVAGTPALAVGSIAVLYPK